MTASLGLRRARHNAGALLRSLRCRFSRPRELRRHASMIPGGAIDAAFPDRAVGNAD
jgi:hypothetical protein